MCGQREQHSTCQLLVLRTLTNDANPISLKIFIVPNHTFEAALGLRLALLWANPSTSCANRFASVATVDTGFCRRFGHKYFPVSITITMTAVPGAVTIQNKLHDGLFELIPPTFIPNAPFRYQVRKMGPTTNIVSGKNNAAIMAKNSTVSL